ncbi:hypothetical protein ACHAWF_009098 [Thalassiosira exigua]
MYRALTDEERRKYHDVAQEEALERFKERHLDSTECARRRKKAKEEGEAGGEGIVATKEEEVCSRKMAAWTEDRAVRTDAGDSGDSPGRGGGKGPAEAKIELGLDGDQATADGDNGGDWTEEEHRLFLRGLELHHGNSEKIAELVRTRTAVQVRTHTLIHFEMLKREAAIARSPGRAKVGRDEGEEDTDRAPRGGHVVENTGLWTEEEHRLFLRGLEQHGKGRWAEIAEIVATRTNDQVRRHAQSYFRKPARQNGVAALASTPNRADFGRDLLRDLTPSPSAEGAGAIRAESMIAERRRDDTIVAGDCAGPPARKRSRPLSRTVVELVPPPPPEKYSGWNTGRWTAEEHRRFMEGLERYGEKQWREIAVIVGTQNRSQVKKHANAHFRKLNEESRRLGSVRVRDERLRAGPWGAWLY